MSNEWISVKDKGRQPMNKTWVEVKHSLLDEPLEWFYWDKYDWKDPHITHWRYISLDISGLTSACTRIATAVLGEGSEPEKSN